MTEVFGKDIVNIRVEGGRNISRELDFHRKAKIALSVTKRKGHQTRRTGGEKR